MATNKKAPGFPGAFVFLLGSLIGLEPGDILLIASGPLIDDNGIKIGRRRFVIGVDEIAVVGVIQIQFFMPVLEDTTEADKAAFI